MSIDRSLKVKSALTRHRNVLTRAERVTKLKEEEKWSDECSLFGLPKVGHRKSKAGKKEKALPGAEAVAGVAAAPAAAEAGAKTAATKAPAATKGAAAAPAKKEAAKKEPAKKESAKKDKG